MDRSAWTWEWKRLAAAALAAAAAGAGCGGSATQPLPPAEARAPYEARRPAVASNTPPEGEYPRVGDTKPNVSWDTERDKTFARFLENHSAGMVKAAAVGIENRGELKVEISRAVEPEDTLTLTKSLMSGARKDFPDRPITLSLFDPQGQPILKARYRPGEGVRYQIAHETNPAGKATDRATAEPPAASPRPSAGGDILARGGVTARDQKFAAWAESHGRPMLRYVEADLENHGRLWFGITRDVKPEDVKPLTRSLLEGARKEFPRGGLVATVFDPDGERIGRAKLVADGEVTWEK